MSAVPAQPRELRPIQPSADGRPRSAAAAARPIRHAENKENRPAAPSTAATGTKPAHAQTKQAPSKKSVLPTAPPVIVDAHGYEYLTGRVLGQGGFARVYDARAGDGTHYAFKVIDKASVLSSKRNRGKLLAEMKIHKSMRHPHIVGFLDEFEDTANVYFKLELCAYGSINDMIKKRGRFSEEESRYFMIQILTACQHMHLNSVIHRDLKLGNIMLDASMQIKIGDFGLAALLSYPEERKRTVCGTPNYIAPEILYDQGQGHSFEVDIWSVGVILYTLVVGKPPFQTSNVQKIYERIKRNEYEIPPECPVSPEARELIGAILQPDPSIRPTLIQIMNHPWIALGSVPCVLPASSVTAQAILPRISPAQSQANLLELQQIGQWIPNADDELPEDLEDIEMTDAEPAGREDLRSRLGTMVDIENQRAQANSEAERAMNPDMPVSTLLKAGQPLQKVPPSAAAPSRAPRRPHAASQSSSAPARPPFTARIVDHLSAAMTAYDANTELAIPLPRHNLTASAALGPTKATVMMAEARPDGTVRRCPPVPSAFILSWLDASDRYGLGYALSNGSVGVHFRDGSTTVLAPSRSGFEYVCPTRRAASSGTSTPQDAESQLGSDLLRRKEYPLPRGSSGEILCEAATDQAATALRQAADQYLSKDLVNKLEILMYFQAEITDRLCGADHPLMRLPSPGSADGAALPFVHRWFRATTAIVFVFSDDLVQFNFYDHIKVLISNRGAVVGAIIPNEAPLAGTPGGPPVHLLYTWRLDELVNITRRDRSQREAAALSAAHNATASRPSVPLSDLVNINITTAEERRAARRVWRKLPVCREVLAKSAGLDV